MKFSIYNNTRTVDLFDRIVNDYEKTTKNKLDTAKIEDILRTSYVTEVIKYMSDENISRLIEKELCKEAYMPYAFITLYGNRTVKIPLMYAEPYARYQGFTPKSLELLIHLSDYYDKLDKMSNEELEKAVIELISEELKAILMFPKIIGTKFDTTGIIDNGQ